MDPGERGGEECGEEREGGCSWDVMCERRIKN